VVDGSSRASETDPHGILVFSVDSVSTELVDSALRDAPFEVRFARSAAEAEVILGRWHPMLALLEMDHPESAALLRRLATLNTMRRPATAILGLTGRADVQARLQAFELGVDDILTVPFSPQELMARSIAVIHRTSGAGLPIAVVHMPDGVEIDIAASEIRAEGSVVRLSGNDQKVLFILASRGGAVVTRREILDAVWGASFDARSNLVDVAIRRVREKLHDDPGHPRFIATEPGKGYRFIPVSMARGQESGPAPAEGPSEAALLSAARRHLRSRDAASAAADLAALNATGARTPAISAHRVSIHAGLVALDGRSADALPHYADALRQFEELRLAVDVALTLIEMTTLLDPGLPEVATALESGRAILGRLGA
jgi:two-component system, OmpR family, KDP operon response regulator KdpE